MANVAIDIIIKLIRQTPEKDVAIVCSTLKLTQNKVFKNALTSKAASKTPHVDSLVQVFSKSDAGVLSSIYKSIEGVLFLGGCAPGVGIAFNVIDACFCMLLNNWIGALVAIISCFPIPGFKVAGKGLEKLLEKLVVTILKRISPTDMTKLAKLLNKQLAKIACNSEKSFMTIGSKIEELVKELNNPFASETIKILSKTVRSFMKKDAQKATAAASKNVSKAVQSQSQNTVGFYNKLNCYNSGTMPSLEEAILTNMKNESKLTKGISQYGQTSTNSMLYRINTNIGKNGPISHL